MYKKHEEIEVLNNFNNFYLEITDDYLKIVQVTERPDFICKRNDNTLVGVELVQIRRGHPELVLFDEIVNKNINMIPEKALELIQHLIMIKEEKRQSKDWQLSDLNILIVQLIESPLWEIKKYLFKEYFTDLKDYGFIEIWLADFTEFEAYNNIELFCLYPFSQWGYYKRPLQKPYG